MDLITETGVHNLTIIMTERTPLFIQIDTLPNLVRTVIQDFSLSIHETFTPKLCQEIDRLTIVGCGDSHHAGICAELAFEQLAGIPCEPKTAMQFSRYAVDFLPSNISGKDLLLGISVSGGVSRTIEALELGRQAGALTIAITGNQNSPIAQAADSILLTSIRPMPGEKDLVVPGTRSYIASQCALYLLAIHLGVERGHLSARKAAGLQQELYDSADRMEQTLSESDKLARALVNRWADATEFVYCGAGPNFGTAMFSAAKMLEASGDSAIGQDMEEWAHLQYFAKANKTPTLLISGGKRDEGRTYEIATAAAAIGRRVAIICFEDSALVQFLQAEFKFIIPGKQQECFSPLTLCLPGIMLADYRAQLTGEPYFRAFGGGRSAEGGGGISRIRTSDRLRQLPTKI